MYQLYCKMRVHSIKCSTLNWLHSQLNATCSVVKKDIQAPYMLNLFIDETGQALTILFLYY